MPGHFNKVHKTALAGVVLGTILCLVGLAYPYWIVLNSENTSQLPPVLADLHFGLWEICGHVFGDKECDTFEVESVTVPFHAIRACSLLCLFLGWLASIVTIILAVDGHDIRPIFVGVTSFLGGLFGVIAVGIFVGKYKETTDLNLTGDINVEDLLCYGWAFGLFFSGAIILIVISVAACFFLTGLPNNSIRLQQIKHCHNPGWTKSLQHRSFCQHGSWGCSQSLQI